MTEHSTESIFNDARQIADPVQRAAYLEHACAGDADLRARVERLLAAEPQLGSFLEPPAAPEPSQAPAASSHTAATELPLPSTSDQVAPLEGVGAVIAGRYKLVQKLGEGGMGAVFMAEQTVPVRRMVAVKLIKPGMDSSHVLARFEAERQALALMDHPNIAKVLDAGASAAGRPYFVMELVKGISITKYCDQERLTPRDRLELFIPVCQAVQHAHQKGIIHRDLKPSNVLIALYDGMPVPKVIDFGVAKATAQRLTERTMFTEVGQIVGTLEYMSPEQAELNQLDVDTRSDVYSLGVLLYELLTGAPPFSGKQLRAAGFAAMLMMIREMEPSKPSTKLSKSDELASIAAKRKLDPRHLTNLVRGDLDWIVMKCLEKERSRRYDTANGLAHDIERYLADEPVQAGPPTALYRLRKFVRRNRTAVAASAAFVLVLVAATLISAWQAVLATRAETKIAKALDVADQNRRDADRERQVAVDERQKAETQAASRTADVDLKYCQGGEVVFGLLRLADTLRSVPEHAKALRECVALNILAWGQRLRPAIGPLRHDGYPVIQSQLSPDGLTVLTVGQDGTARLWDSLTGKQRCVLGDAPIGSAQFGGDGSTALTVSGKPGAIGEVFSSDGIVRLWNVATGQLRAATSAHVGTIFGARLSQNGARLVTASVSPGGPSNLIFVGDALTGRPIRTLQLHGSARPSLDLSPDGKVVLIGQDDHFSVWFPEEDRLLKPLPGDRATFSPSGLSAISLSDGVAYWWNASDWQPFRTFDWQPFKTLEKGLRPMASVGMETRFFTDDLAAVTNHRNNFTLTSAGRTYPWRTLLIVKQLPTPIEVPRTAGVRSPKDGHFATVGSQVYDIRTGLRLPVPGEHYFPPELLQLADDDRFARTDNLSIVDLAADKQIEVDERSGGVNADSDDRFIKSLKTWVVLDRHDGIVVLRQAGASLDANLLQTWCQVVARGRLDDNRQFSKFDEPTWQKARLELMRLLEVNPNARSMCSAATDPLYWLRQQIKESSEPLALLDRLISLEPTWPNYSQRAAVHERLQHWDLALRDDLEAGRLAGNQYWLRGQAIDWHLAADCLQTPGLPREHYQLALHWVEEKIRSGAPDYEWNSRELRPARIQPAVIGLALFRLGRDADALAALHSRDIPMLATAAGMLMSPWNVALYQADDGGQVFNAAYFNDPLDLVVRAICHQHLGHAKEAKACLRRARPMYAVDYRSGLLQEALLHEAEELIERDHHR